MRSKRRLRSGGPEREASRWGRGHPGSTSPRTSEAPEEIAAPLFHTVSSKVRRELWEAYVWFVAAFRDAAEKLRAGNRHAAFPTGSFPPALPFVGG